MSGDTATAPRLGDPDAFSRNRRPPSKLQEVDVEQRLPGDLLIGLDDDHDRVGDVMDGQEVLGQRGCRHLRQPIPREHQDDPPGAAVILAMWCRMAGDAAVVLYWLPLGAGGRFVRLNGRMYEAVAARLQRRPPCDLYHSALQLELPEGKYVIEQAPVHDWSGSERGVVAEGPVGSRWAGRFRIFRYEIRVWRGGHIPDVAEAVDSPQCLSANEGTTRRVLEVVQQVPTPVWGRDELGTGEMWNSNSVIAWVIARSGIDTESIQPPAGGRAPGWQAGLAVARR
jgi:hypothetical protein